MELTLEQALQKGIEAHKAGKVQEADRYYTAILKADPKHPDANHNMGILAVGVGKVEEALPFLKIALEANPNMAQFWLSYIDALIKLDRMADAKAVFDQAKSNGAKGDSFDQLESILTNVAQIESDQTDKAIIKQAVDLRETGKYDEAIDLLKNSISNFPADPNIPAILSHCYILNDNLEQAKIYLDVAKNINPNIASVGWNETRLLLKQKKVSQALAIADKTNKLFPDDVEGMGVLGSCLRSSGSFDESLK
jgi:tetratricopeptide (TPR) repeat protein